MSQCRWPGSTSTQFGGVRRISANSSAVSSGALGRNTIGLVTTRRKPLRTSPDMPYGSWPASRPRSQAA